MIFVPILAERLLEMYGWRGAFLILAGINFHALIAAALTRTPHDQGLFGKSYDLSTSRSRWKKIGPLTKTDSANQTRNSHQISDNTSGEASKPAHVELCLINGDDSIHSTNEIHRHDGSKKLSQSSNESHAEFNEDKRACQTARGNDISRSYESTELTEILTETGQTSNKNETLNERNSCLDISTALSRLCGTLAPVRNLFKDYPVFLPLLVSYLLLGVSVTGVMIFLVPNAEDKGIKLSLATVLSSIFGLGDLVGRPLIGLLHTNTQWNAIKLSMGVSVFCAGTLFIYPFSYVYAILAVNAFINGASLGAICVLSAIVLTEIFPEELFKKTFGLYYLSFGIGAPLGGLFAGIKLNS